MFRTIVFFLAVMIASPSSAEIIRIKHSGWITDEITRKSEQFSGAFYFDTKSHSGGNSSLKFINATSEYLNIGDVSYGSFISASAQRAPYFRHGLLFNHFMSDSRTFTMFFYFELDDYLTIPGTVQDYNDYHNVWISQGRTVTHYGQGRIAASLASAVPEPGTWTMMLLGFFAMGIAIRRKGHFLIPQHQ